MVHKKFTVKRVHSLKKFKNSLFTIHYSPLTIHHPG